MSKEEAGETSTDSLLYLPHPDYHRHSQTGTTRQHAVRKLHTWRFIFICFTTRRDNHEKEHWEPKTLCLVRRNTV
ncbi:MAG: hypothetical protein ACU83O_07335, partial [Gammaproteobacteria bacterium]